MNNAIESSYFAKDDNHYCIIKGYINRSLLIQKISIKYDWLLKKVI